MWVYINDIGQVVTSIPHGQIVRQGSTFEVYVAFNVNYFKNQSNFGKFFGDDFCLYSIERLSNWINSNLISTFSFDNMNDVYIQSQKVYFEKIKENENTCLLKDKKWYLVFKYIGTTEASKNYGTFNLNLRLSKPNDNIVKVIGPIPIYIEKTYGDIQQNVNVTREQIDELLDYVKNKSDISFKVDLEFNSYHEFANYCLNELADKIKENFILGIVKQDRVFALVNKNNNKVIMLSSDGNLLCSDGANYYYITSYDMKLLNQLMINDVALYVYNNKLIIKDLYGESKIDPGGISSGTLIGQPFLEVFALEKQKEAMSVLSNVEPIEFNKELFKVWIDTSENVTPFNIESTNITTNYIEELLNENSNNENDIIYEQNNELLLNETQEELLKE